MNQPLNGPPLLSDWAWRASIVAHALLVVALLWVAQQGSVLSGVAALLLLPSLYARWLVEAPAGEREEARAA